MITKEQALALDELHYSNWHRSDGKCQRVRRNGKTRTWKKDLERFCFPGKWGLRDYPHITNDNAHLFHAPDDCPLLKAENIV